LKLYIGNHEGENVWEKLMRAKGATYGLGGKKKQNSRKREKKALSPPLKRQKVHKTGEELSGRGTTK